MMTKKKWIGLFIVAIMFAFLAACSEKEHANEQKPVLLSDALEEYSIWFYVYGTPNGPTEDSEVLSMFVFKGDKVKEYHLNHIDLNLRDVTKYSDEELISYVEEQLSVEIDSYEEPEEKSYTLDIHQYIEENKTGFMSVVVEEEDVLLTLTDKAVSQTIEDTEFVGLVNDNVPSAEEELFVTRVDEPSLIITFDQPDTTKRNVTVDEWMERQKQKDLEGKDLRELEEEEFEEIFNDPAAEIYAQSCLACHGENLEGNIGPDLTLVGSRFSRIEIKDIALHGIGNMPPGLVDNEEDAEALAEWLREYMK